MAVIDLLSRINTDAAVLRARLETLTQQTTTGLRSRSLGDLGTDQLPAVNVKAELQRLDAYGTAIDAVTAKNGTTVSVLKQLGDIASSFADSVAIKLDPNDPAGITQAATQARQALKQAALLLNSQQNGEYLFGGTDLANPPVPNADSIDTSAFANGIAAAVGSLGIAGAAATAASTKGIAQSDAAGVTPFSAFLSDPTQGLTELPRAVPTADGQTIAYGISANRNAIATSTGETTGSWARDLLRGLASLAALTPASASSAQDFRDFATVIRNGLRSARDAIADEGGALGQTTGRLKAIRSTQADAQTALTKQLSGLQDVDVAATITKLQGTQTALQASYSAISQLGALSLVQFLR